MGVIASPPRAPGAGLLDSLRAIGATLEDSVRVRGALFALELREEVARRKSRLVLAVAAGTFLHMAFLLATALVAVLFWDTHRVAALAVMAALYLAGAAALLLRLRASAAASPDPFAETLRELGRDLAPLRHSQ
jgi:uncharacterized membrane protein YqjE